VARPFTFATSLLAAAASLSLLAGALPAAAAPPAQEAPPAPPDPSYFRTASPEYGVSTFLWDRPEARAVLEQAHGAGFGWQKSLIKWRDIEGAGKGQLDWGRADEIVRDTEKADLNLLVRVDFQPAWARADGVNNGPPDNLQDYADFIGRLAWRYNKDSRKGRVHAIQVWNEPNLSREWGGQMITQQSAAQYVQLLCAAYRAAKQSDPYVTVVTAGLSPTGTADGTAQPDEQYLQWMYDAGMRGCYDALGVHAPGFKAAPSVSPDEAAADPNLGGQRFFSFRHVEDLRAVMERNGDGDKQVWVLEFGWTSDSVNPAYAWHAVSEDQKAQYLVDAFRWAREHWAPWIGVMTAWTMANPAWTPQNEEYWWSITNPDGSPRPAFMLFASERASGMLP
jgi:hypothetical protein